MSQDVTQEFQARCSFYRVQRGTGADLPRASYEADKIISIDDIVSPSHLNPSIIKLFSFHESSRINSARSARHPKS